MQVSQALKLFRKELPDGYTAGIGKEDGGYEIDVIKKTDATEDGAMGCRFSVKALSRGKLYGTMADAVAFLERQERSLKAKQAALKEVA